MLPLILNLNKRQILLVAFSLLITLLGFKLKLPNILGLCDVDKCPFCYGKDLCHVFENSEIILNTFPLSEAFNNIFGVKNVFFADWNGSKVVLKKLGSNDELSLLDQLLSEETNNLTDAILKKFGRDSHQSFRFCDDKSPVTFLNYLIRSNYDTERIWTIQNINIEPLILTVFKNEWPVPKLHGACGRLIVEDYRGESLINFVDSNWLERVNISLQILKSSYEFTTKHDTFRLYLTDLSADNIVVDENLMVYFIDLEHVIININEGNVRTFHKSYHFEEDYAFSSREICSYDISDHNIYSICRLILSGNAPEPLPGGFLHSMPDSSQTNKLTDLIESCVQPPDEKNRFEIYEDITNLMNIILS